MDLKTSYLGIELKNPIVPSASPLSLNISTIRALEDYGASAIVLYSMFEEQIRFEKKNLHNFLTYNIEHPLEIFPQQGEYYRNTDEYLEHITSTKKAVNIPVIASINGTNVGEWMNYAKEIEQAGADALEINLYHIPTDPDIPSEEIEQLYLNIVKHIRSIISIPIAVKLSPFFTSLANMAKKFYECGANGLVLFNRFYQPNIDIELQQVTSNISLSNSEEMRLPLRWIAILHKTIELDLAASSGIHTATDVIKLTMAGANVTMMCSALLQHGTKHIQEVLTNVQQWMVEHEYSSLSSLRGIMSYKTIKDPSVFERAHYLKALNSYM